MSACYAIPMYIRCRCNVDGKINGKKCPDCGGFGVLLEELPPRPTLGQLELDL
jgi:hypothetical protein